MHRVLIYGLGAIGGYYTFVVDNSKECEVSVVARSNYEPVKAHGLKFKSIHFPDSVVKPAHVYKAGETKFEGRFDFIICSNKALDPEAVPKDIAPAVTPGVTTIVMIQNGVGAEDPVRRAFPENTIITCVTWVGAKQPTPGSVEHFNNNLLTMGGYWNANVERAVEEKRLQTFHDIIIAGGSKVEIDPDIIAKRWEKVVWNAAWNSFTALTMIDTKQFLNSSDVALPLSRRLMDEIITVAHAAGVKVDPELREKLIQKTLDSQGLTSSMMMDLAAGRPMEVEGILGTPMRTARQYDIPTPTLDTLYVLVKAQDWRVRNPSKA